MTDSPTMNETTPQEPFSPYARTKLAVEWMIRDFAAAYGLGFTLLRYFNAAGADPGGQFGEDHRPENHLIPLVLQTALGQRDKILIFGEDYPTPDGTCIRDYVHTSDLASAHRLAIEATTPETAEVFNIGTGVGQSVKDIITACEKIVGHPIPHEITARRPGDPPRLVADPAKLKTQLGWEPAYTDIEKTIATAWEWHRTHPNGYERRNGQDEIDRGKSRRTWTGPSPGIPSSDRSPDRHLRSIGIHPDRLKLHGLPMEAKVWAKSLSARRYPHALCDLRTPPVRHDTSRPSARSGSAAVRCEGELLHYFLVNPAGFLRRLPKRAGPDVKAYGVKLISYHLMEIQRVRPPTRLLRRIATGRLRASFTSRETPGTRPFPWPKRSKSGLYFSSGVSGPRPCDLILTGSLRCSNGTKTC